MMWSQSFGCSSSGRTGVAGAGKTANHIHRDPRANRPSPSSLTTNGREGVSSLALSPSLAHATSGQIELDSYNLTRRRSGSDHCLEIAPPAVDSPLAPVSKGVK